MADIIATREAYGKALAEFGDTYDMVVMDADLSGSTKTGVFAKKFPILLAYFLKMLYNKIIMQSIRKSLVFGR